MRSAIIALVLFGTAIVGFLTWFVLARRLTGEPGTDLPLKRRLRFVMIGSFILLAAALVLPSLLQAVTG